ncbi:MAG: ribosome maturation factor RimM [Alphaproteobacteria bacterium]|nr:ribosome maturation factor RimM [Alphaproteobacteria bacterium]
MDRDVLLAAVIGAHGLKGEVRVKTFTESPDRLGAYGPLHARDGRSFTVEAVRPAGAGEAVVALREVADRSAAEALKGVELFVTRAVLPMTGEGEFYHADLVGLSAEDSEGRRIGRITGVHNFGAGDVLVIAGEAGEEILLAFTRANVPEIDMAAGRVVVAVPDEIEDRGGAA